MAGHVGAYRGPGGPPPRYPAGDFPPLPCRDPAPIPCRGRPRMCLHEAPKAEEAKEAKAQRPLPAPAVTRPARAGWTAPSACSASPCRTRQGHQPTLPSRAGGSETCPAGPGSQAQGTLSRPTRQGAPLKQVPRPAGTRPRHPARQGQLLPSVPSRAGWPGVLPGPAGCALGSPCARVGTPPPGSQGVGLFHQALGGPPTPVRALPPSPGCLPPAPWGVGGGLLLYLGARPLSQASGPYLERCAPRGRPSVWASALRRRPPDRGKGIGMKASR